MGSTLVVRLDNVGDVILTGPAVRAIATVDGPVTYLASSAGAAAAELLPGVESVVVFDAPWVAYESPPVDNAAIAALLEIVADRHIERALIVTSFQQSPLPIALLLRMAGVGYVAATSVDYPGSLLDVRQPYIEQLHEVEQALALASAAGYPLPDDDDLRIRVERGGDLPFQSYVIVHPGASVPARALPRDAATFLVSELNLAGYNVVVTGSADESMFAGEVAGAGMPGHAINMAGTTDVRRLAQLIAGAAAVVCGNSSPAHIAAATGTPVVEAFAPTVPAHRWHPWRVPHVLLGALDIGCAGCRSRRCPVPGQPCLRPFTAAAALAAVRRLAGPARTTHDVEMTAHVAPTA